MEKYDARLIIERMKESIKAQNDRVLAALLDVPPTNISNWRSRNSLPLEYVTDFAQKTNASTDWLLFGKSQAQTLTDVERMALMAFNALDDKKKLEAIAFMSGLPHQGTQLSAGVSQSVLGNVNNMVGGNQVNK